MDAAAVAPSGMTTRTTRETSVSSCQTEKHAEADSHAYFQVYCKVRIAHGSPRYETVPSQPKPSSSSTSAKPSSLATQHAAPAPVAAPAAAPNAGLIDLLGDALPTVNAPRAVPTADFGDFNPRGAPAPFAPAPYAPAQSCA